jgi:transposase-like protein
MVMAKLKLGRFKKVVKGEPDMLTREEFERKERAIRIALIQRLIPLGLMAAAEELQREVASLAEATEGVYRHGSNPGTVLLGSQKVPIQVPRVRGPKGEIPLESYKLLHEGVEIDQSIISQLFGGLSCRGLEKAQLPHPGTIGKSKSTASRRFVKASENRVKEFLERDLSALDLVAVFIDGKYFGDCQMIIALGVGIDGVKHCLGFVEADSENKAVIAELFRSLIARGLSAEASMLFIIDGSKGLRSAIREVFGRRAVVQRCQWHKRENIVSYLPKGSQTTLRQRIQRAYDRPTLDEANRALAVIENELAESNQSAARSLLEGKDETLTLHRLGLQASIGASFRTTNCIESLNALAEQKCGRVDSWKNSEHRQRWLSLALLEVEPNLRKVKGYAQLEHLRRVIQNETNKHSQNLTK